MEVSTHLREAILQGCDSGTADSICQRHLFSNQPTRISLSVNWISTPAAFAASCNAAFSITVGSLLTSRRRIRPSPFFVPTDKVILRPFRLQETRVPSGSLVFIGFKNASV